MLGRWISNNVSVLLTIAVLGGGALIGYSRLENQVGNLDAAGVARDGRLAAIEASLSRLQQVEYRTATNEEAIRQTNARFDTTLATISERLAEINQALGSLSTQVAVLTQRLEASAPQRRVDVRPPG